MKILGMFLLGMTWVLSARTVPGQENKSAEDEDIRFALDSAASELGWSDGIESAPLSADDTMFLVRNTRGVLAITRYAESTAAQAALAAAGGGEKIRFHQFDAIRRAKSASLTWVSDALVFSAGSGAGEAEKLAETLFQAAVEGGLIEKQAAAKVSDPVSGNVSAGLSGFMKEPPEPPAPPGPRGAGDPAALEKLQAEYGTPPAEGTVDEAAEMARDLYGIDYRKTVGKAVAGDEGELANLFVMSLDGAAAEIHAGVLYRLRQDLGAETFDAMLSRQAAISRKRVNDLIDHHRENAGMTTAVPQPPSTGPADDPGNYLVGGTFEAAASLQAGEGSLATDPLNPENRVLAFTADNHLVRPLAIPADVNDVKVTLRVLAPPTTRLEMLEPGRMAPGVKIRVRHSNGQENSGIGEWIVNPGEGWQELTMVLHDIGDFRKELSLEASWFDGAILLDDLKVTNAFPVFLAEEIYEHYATPAQVTYFYVVDPLFNSGRVSNVGSPEISDRKVSIDFVLDGEKQVLWFVERNSEDDRAEVVVGPPNAGGDLFRLRRIDGKWAIAGIEEPEGI